MDRPAVIQNDKFHVSHDTILAFFHTTVVFYATVGM